MAPARGETQIFGREDVAKGPVILGDQRSVGASAWGAAVKGGQGFPAVVSWRAWF
jgi:hypothetical protein